MAAKTDYTVLHPNKLSHQNAAAPITGGIICPPADATHSTAPAYSGAYPTDFIKGIVITPVVATFAEVLPLTVPIRPLAKADTLAGRLQNLLPVPMQDCLKT